MTPRDRLLTALAHQEPDCVPLDFGATMETTIHLAAYRRLKEKLQIAGDLPIREKLKTAQFAIVDSEVSSHLRSDVRGVQPAVPADHDFRFHTENGYELMTDEFGITWRKGIDSGLYYDMCIHPLADASVEEMRSYPFPDPRKPARFRGIDEEITALSEDETYPIVFDNSFGNGILQMCNHLMGFDKFLMALALGEARATWLLDKVLEMKLEFWDEVITRFGRKIDITKELDDMGTQTGLFISPEMYRSVVKPRLARLVRFIKDRAPHVTMMMHSCGSIRGIIGDLIDAGIEILNPIQYTAAEMDPAELKREFGRDLTFWGGGIETQNTLANGSPQDVAAETRKQMDILMPGGGFVFAQVHSIQDDVSVENMMAMWETVHEHGSYTEAIA